MSIFASNEIERKIDKLSVYNNKKEENSTIEMKVTDKKSKEVDRLEQALKGANEEIKIINEIGNKNIDLYNEAIGEIRTHREEIEKYKRMQHKDKKDLRFKRDEIEKLGKDNFALNSRISLLDSRIKRHENLEDETDKLKEDIEIYKYALGEKTYELEIKKGSIDNSKSDLSIIDMAKKIKEYCNDITCSMCIFSSSGCKLNKNEPTRWNI